MPEGKTGCSFALDALDVLAKASYHYHATTSSFFPGEIAKRGSFLQIKGER